MPQPVLAPSRARHRRAAALPAIALRGMLAVVVGGCSRQEPARTEATRGELLVSVQPGTISAPDTVTAGWTRLRVEETGGNHIVVLFRLANPTGDTDLPAFAAALDGAATPVGAVALGGPEVGDSGEVIVELLPGRYLLGCMTRGGDEHRHAAAGEVRMLVATGDGDPTPEAAAPAPNAPVATQEVKMTDFAYVGPDRWRAGGNVLAVRNVGAQDHQFRLARLRPGATLGEWSSAKDPRQVATDVAGVARLGAGQVAYLPVDLPAGEYVAYCLVPDPASGRPHVMLGMMRAIRVAERLEDAP